MAQRVLHQPRVAWDVARIVVAAAELDDETTEWLATRLGEVAGTDLRLRFTATRDVIRQSRRVDVHQVEVGVWRVRLQDLLGEDPDLAEDLWLLSQQAMGRLAPR